MIIPLLDGLDLDRPVITADALRCQCATVGYPHRRGADFVLPAKDNQPGLFDYLDALPWRNVPVTHTATDRGHGRVTTRTDATRGDPGTIAGLVRGQRAIESLHWVRDTLYREDNSAVRTRSGPRAMAALRNLAIGALHQHGRHDTTEATRWASRYMDRPFTILGLTS